MSKESEYKDLQRKLNDLVYNAKVLSRELEDTLLKWYSWDRQYGS